MSPIILPFHLLRLSVRLFFYYFDPFFHNFYRYLCSDCGDIVHLSQKSSGNHGLVRHACFKKAEAKLEEEMKETGQDQDEEEAVEEEEEQEDEDGGLFERVNGKLKLKIEESDEESEEEQEKGGKNDDDEDEEDESEVSDLEIGENDKFALPMERLDVIADEHRQVLLKSFHQYGISIATSHVAPSFDCLDGILPSIYNDASWDAFLASVSNLGIAGPSSQTTPSTPATVLSKPASKAATKNESHDEESSSSEEETPAPVKPSPAKATPAKQ